ncbi:MBL fold metallo-hydrolase [Desulfovibrio sp. OttesenSCG-928-C14]|nr:MBL fold metallo-hydrolase [Desulfovibrio sp. OttesenSCG-928-C14]
MPTRIHYLSNAGIMVESGEKKVLIDALISHGHPVFNKYSPEIERRILSGEPPFDGVDLLLFTHYHLDHFDRHLAAQFCRNHPQVPVLSTGQAAKALRPLLPGWLMGEDHLHELNLEIGQAEKLELAGLELTALALLHSGKEFAREQNLAFILHLEKPVTHTGDAVNNRNNFSALLAAGAGGGVFVAPFPYITLPLACKQFRNLLEPETLIAMHLPYPHCDPGGWIEAAHAALQKQRDAGLNVILAEEEGSIYEV